MSIVAGTVNGGDERALSRRDKIRLIFDRFDLNNDGGLDREELSSLISAVNPSVNFTPDQVASIVDEVFRSYSDLIPDPETCGLPLSALVLTYDLGAGDLDLDFNQLFNPNNNPIPNPNPSLGEIEISHESTSKAVEDLEIAIRVLRRHKSGKDSSFFDKSSENGWATDYSLETGKSDENLKESRVFAKAVREIRARIDRLPTTDEAFDGHMAIGRRLHDGRFFGEAAESFRRAIELRPVDVRAHFRFGNSLMLSGKASEAKDCYLTALKLAESDSVRWSEILPQVHVNLGIVMEGEGLLINASEHYREAAIFCPTHYRALKLLGSALFGVGEYGMAEKALEDAILLKPDFADAHCDLGSLLHAIGDEERGVVAFQKAIDLKANHLDALYNLGGLFKDVGRYGRAAEMYGRVLAIHPDNWRAQLNRAVSLLGAGEEEEAKKALSEAFKMTNRVELYDAIRHLKQLERKPEGGAISWVVEDASKFKLADKKTTGRKQLAGALWIRELQKATKLGRCNVDHLMKEMERIEVPVSYSSSRLGEKSIRKSELEIIIRKLLHFLVPETFRGAVKAINEKIWAVLDVTGSGKVDYGMFFAIIAPICEGSPEKRKRAAFDALSSRSLNDYALYFRYMRVIYFPSQGFTDLMEIHGGGEDMGISFREFLDRFDDVDYGFGVLNTVVKLEDGDKKRRCKYSCEVCRYQVAGFLFKETTTGFSLCSSCYSEGKVPLQAQREEYNFKEYLIR